jgi:hypothetical protein
LRPKAEAQDRKEKQFKSHVEANGRSARFEREEAPDRTLRPKAEAQDRKKKKHDADAETRRADENAWFPDTLHRLAGSADPAVEGTRLDPPVMSANGEFGFRSSRGANGNQATVICRGRERSAEPQVTKATGAGRLGRRYRAGIVNHVS